GVGGVTPRGVPLSRSSAQPCRLSGRRRRTGIHPRADLWSKASRQPNRAETLPTNIVLAAAICRVTALSPRSNCSAPSTSEALRMARPPPTAENGAAFKATLDVAGLIFGRRRPARLLGRDQPNWQASCVDQEKSSNHRPHPSGKSGGRFATLVV